MAHRHPRSLSLTRRRMLQAGSAAATLPLLTHRLAAAETWDLATAFPEGTAQATNVALFAEDIAAASAGGLTVAPFFNGSLLGSGEIGAAVRAGDVPLGELLLAAVQGGDEIVQVDSLPFLANDYDKALRLWQVSRQRVQKRLWDSGLSLLFVAPWPNWGLLSRVPVEKVADFPGLAIGVQTPLEADFVSRLGSQSQVLGLAAIQNAIATGRIDAAFLPPAIAATVTDWTAGTSFLAIDAWWLKSAVVANKQMFEAESTARQEQVIAAGNNAESRAWVAAQRDAQSAQTQIERVGLSYRTPSQELLQALRSAAQGVGSDWLRRAERPGEALLRAYRA